MLKAFILILLILHPALSYGQAAPEADFITSYNNGDYKRALEIITAKIDGIYSEKVDNKRIPMDIIAYKGLEQQAEDREKLRHLFRIRKAQGFFIEENSELSKLHVYAARCYFKLYQYDASLNHYYQALRYKKTEKEKDAEIYYEISQSYKKLDHFNAYIDTLESAYTLDPSNYDYSLELGKALEPTSLKKKAIYHLERYLDSKDGRLEEPDLLLLTGNLYESTGRYLDTARYYKKYLNFKKNDGYIFFALGYISYKHTGNYKLALDCFRKTLELLPDSELYRRSKAHEYTGDIKMKNLEFEDAVNSYLQTIKYQDSLEKELQEREEKIRVMEDEIRSIKASIIKDRAGAFDKYNKYQYLQEEKGKIELVNRERKYELAKLNPGKTRWNIAESLERLENPEKAVQYYRESISYNYKSNSAREKIVKLQLKIKRGY